MSVTTHSVDFETSSATNVVYLKVSGKLTKEDYELFVPELERCIEVHGKIRILFEMSDFHGWTLAAGWEDFKLGFKHFLEIERIAMVGDTAWEHGMAVLCKPFTAAKVKYFDHTQREEALEWIVA
ncbi:MAG: STAS/SEC14 domain-containing protein [Planctomycetales bacterium]|nr:STAS/SEC14 domain-containing protein [Planctomycetales bacterium]